MEKELLLLGLLRRNDMHGYQLHDFIERNMATCTDLKKSAAYYLLDQMAQRGWLRVSEESAEGKRPVRRIYTVTDEGESAYQSLLRANLAQAFSTTFPGNVGLAYLDDLPPAEVLSLLQRRLSQLQAQAKVLQEVPDHPGSLQYLIDHQRHHLRSEITWLERVLDNLYQQLEGENS